MSDVYSKRLAGPLNVGTTSAVVYTAPASVVAIVTHIHIVRYSWTANATYTLSINGTTTATWVLRSIATEEGTDILETRLILNPGDTLSAVRQTGVGIVLTVNGYELSDT